MRKVRNSRYPKNGPVEVMLGDADWDKIQKDMLQIACTLPESALGARGLRTLQGMATQGIKQHYL